MGHVYSWRRQLPIGRSRLVWLLCFCSHLVVASWGQDVATPGFDLVNPQLALEAIRQSHGLPGLGAAIVTDEGLQLLATTGVRKKGDTTPVTDEDLWHLGSCGKAMTATMIARLVEAGKLRFEQTVGETFPKLGAKLSDPVKAIKLIDLLSHTSGMPANFELQNYVGEKNSTRARRKVLFETSGVQLLSTTGEKYLYSNWGYTLAGHMAEEATRKSWEVLMATEVFKPLGMSTAGFGGTGTPGKIDQPWPHDASGNPMPSNGKAMDNLPVMGPAGTMHMSLTDWGKFISEHLKGHRGQSSYLTQASFQKLHTAVRDDYALGWMSLERGWAGGKALHHGGDNTMNKAVVWAAPEKGFAVLVVTNQSSASQAADEVAAGLLEAWAQGDAAYPKLAPFNGVRWNEQQPEVRIGKQWCRLLSLNDLPAAEIVAFSQATFADNWQKRFEEDLVELLTRMGHPPQGKVKLEIGSLTSPKTRILEEVPMTAANRQAIRAAGRAMPEEKAGESPENEPGELAIDAELRRRLEGQYQLAPNFVFTVRDRDGRLMVGITNQATQEVFPDSPTRWSYRGVDATLEFKLPKTGPAKSLVLHQNGVEQVAKRVK